MPSHVPSTPGAYSHALAPWRWPYRSIVPRWTGWSFANNSTRAAIGRPPSVTLISSVVVAAGGVLCPHAANASASAARFTSQPEFDAGGDRDAELRLDSERMIERAEAELELALRGDRDAARDRRANAATGVEREAEAVDTVRGEVDAAQPDAAEQERPELALPAEEVAYARLELDRVALREAVVADERVGPVVEARRGATAERERGSAVEPVAIRELIQVVPGDPQPARGDSPAGRDADARTDRLLAHIRWSAYFRDSSRRCRTGSCRTRPASRRASGTSRRSRRSCRNARRSDARRPSSGRRRARR